MMLPDSDGLRTAGSPAVFCTGSPQKAQTFACTGSDLPQF